MHPLINRWLVYTPVTLLKGEVIGQYLRRVERSQWLSADEIRYSQLTQLRDMVQFAKSHSTYYQRVIDETLGHNWLPETLDDARRLPTTTKQDVVQHYDELAVKPSGPFISRKTTGGSTGQAVTIPKDARALAMERAVTWRAYRWAGVSIGDRQARFWGVPLKQAAQRKASLVDWIANRRRLSAFELNDESMRRYAATLERFKPHYLYGYVSIMREFADYLLRTGRTLPRTVRSVICTSEVLDQTTRDHLRAVFGVSVFNEYGCGEVGSIAHECEHGSLHLMAENLFIHAGDTDSEDGGEIHVFDLHNRAMPLLNYRLGDYATLTDKGCECGRGLPVIDKVHGRAYDLIVDPDGTRHHPEVIMYIFEHLKEQGYGIEGFQVIQQDADILAVRLVTEGESIEQLERMLEQLVAETIHPGMHVRCEAVDQIPREPSGKLRLIKSELS